MIDLQDVGEYTLGHFAIKHGIVEKSSGVLRMSLGHCRVLQRRTNPGEDYRMDLSSRWGSMWWSEHELEHCKYQELP